MKTPKSLSKKCALALIQTELGIAAEPETIHVEWRSWRWLAYLPDDRIAFVADSAETARRLAKEGAVLDRLKERVSFGVPSIEFFSPDDKLQVRTRVPGIQVGGGPEKEFGNSKLGRRLASDLGRAFAELHQSLTPEECEALGVGNGGTLPSPRDLESRLSNRIEQREVADAFSIALSRYDAVDVPKRDLVFTHGDPWGGNFAVDPQTGALNGLFDFDEMTVDDRNMDLRYLHSFGTGFKERAVAAYVASAGEPPSTERMNLYHVISAFDALASAYSSKNDKMIAKRQRWVNLATSELI